MDPGESAWLIIRGRADEAEAAIGEIEARFRRVRSELAPIDAGTGIRLRWRCHTPISEVFDTLFRKYRLRTLVGLALMAARAFFHNAIFFTYALVLTKFYSVSPERVGWYIRPFAAGNFLSPVVLGGLFDTLGRRRMISMPMPCRVCCWLAAARCSSKTCSRRSNVSRVRCFGMRAGEWPFGGSDASGPYALARVGRALCALRKTTRPIAGLSNHDRP